MALETTIMTTLTFRGLARKAVLLSLLAGCAETDTGTGTTGDAGEQVSGNLPVTTGSTPAGTTSTGSVDAGVTKPNTALPVDGGVKPIGDAGVTGPASDGGATVPAGDGGAAAVGLSALAAPLPTGEDYKGWTWVAVPGSKCRDGSGAGYFWRRGTTNALMVYLNGGGACADPFFCGLNPVNVNQDLPIELLIGGAPNLIFGPNADRQIAPDEGVFKKDPRNPVADWNMIYVPYCTGDIHSGYRADATVPGVDGKQQFVGGINLGLFLKSFGPSYANVDRVLLTGSSAGGFGSLLNYDRFAEYFTGKDVMAISDSGLPMRDKAMAACLQGKWRTYWGITDSFPKDCTECQGTAGGLTEAAFKYYFSNKYKGKMLGGLITTVNDQIIRAFFAPGLNADGGADDCTLEPGLNTVTSSLSIGSYSGEKYREGLADVLDNLVTPDQMGYYAMAGENHMHLWRPRFFEKNGNTQSIAEWMTDILAKKTTKQGEALLHGK